MNKRFTYSSLIIIVIIIFPLFSLAQLDTLVDPAEKHTGFLSVRVTMSVTSEQYERMLLDSLIWHDVKPLVKYYHGKKIKQMIYQKNSGRVVVYFNRRDNIVIKKNQAVKDGLFDPDSKIKRKEFPIPEKPFEVYLDSPFFIGIENKVTLYQTHLSEVIIPNPTVSIEKTEASGEYIIEVDKPGKVFLLFADSATRKVKYVYHGVAKRLPGDGPDVEPVVQMGIIKGGTTDTGTLRRQDQIVINSNFSLVAGTVYFTGTGFRDVIVADLDKNITYAKPFLGLCMPGSSIIFDSLLVSDPGGKLYSAEGFTITVSDDSFIADGPIDYYPLTTYPQFLWGEGSLENYVKEQVAAYKNISSVGQKVSFILKVEANGKVSPVSESGLSTLSPLEKKCFEIIKNGPAWTPGSFKGENVPMTVTFYCSF